MGKRNRERVARIMAGVEEPRAVPTDPQEKASQGICPFPGCRGEPLRAQGTHGFCAAHEKFVADLLFIIPHIQWQPSAPTSSLVLPGSPDFGIPVQVVKKQPGQG